MDMVLRVCVNAHTHAYTHTQTQDTNAGGSK